MSHHEIAGDALVPAKRRNLPVRILRAFDNAKHLAGLTRGVKDTLAELCRFVAQDRPFDTIFAHKTTIAARIGASERTVYRHLEVLRQHLLIEVLTQDRKSRNGRFTVARIRLTGKAAHLLGFIETPAESVSPSPLPSPMSTPAPQSAAGRTDTTAPIPRPQSTRQIHAEAANTEGKVNVIHKMPYDKMAVGHTLSKPTISKNHPQPRTQNGLPPDLTWMTGQGLSRAGIFKLMGLAKAHGKRLSDITLAVQAYIQPLKGGRLYAYLASLATGHSDFAAMAATMRQRQQAAEQARALEQKARVFRARFRNTTLTNRQQTRLYCIDAQARFVQIFGGVHTSTAPLSDLTPWIERLEKGELLLATQETERRFLA